MFCVHRQLEHISLIFTTNQMPFSSNKHNFNYNNHKAKDIKENYPYYNNNAQQKRHKLY